MDNITQQFNPSGAAVENSGIFGLPFPIEKSKLVLLPVSWDATASYGLGTFRGPSAIFEASKFVELYDVDLGSFYEVGIAMEDPPSVIDKWNRKAKRIASPIIKKGGILSDGMKLRKSVQKVDNFCQKMNSHVYRQTKNYMSQNKIVCLIGGDHSIVLGSIKAHLEKYPKMGVLQIDAHCDLREAFEGFKYSHGSVMYNALEQTKLEKLVQVGIRGFCGEEYSRIKSSSGRIQTFFENDISESKSAGDTWNSICEQIISCLPKDVYISFDIDGLDPKLCPNTGTPVPGGLTYQEALILLKRIVEAEKTIIGFDVVEVTPENEGDWDASVGAHLLYKLSGWCLKSQHLS